MQKPATRIIKADDVKLDGKFQVNGSQPCQVHTQKQNSPAFQIAGVNIVESNQAFAVLEITCSCGAKAHVKCHYNDQDQNN